MARAAKEKTTLMEIQPIKMDSFGAHLMGTTALIMHRFAKKAWQELLYPAQKKNAAAKQESLKHDPLTEFRECVYRNRDDNEPTLIHFPSGGFSKAIAAAALDLPGASKSQILRLVNVKSVQINIFGVPLLGMDMIRNSDMARTPDVRTRAYFPEWTAFIEVEYVSSLIGAKEIINLLSAAGMIVGLGDYRPQKGGQFGKFACVDPNNPDYVRITKTQGRKAQMAALQSPSFYSQDAEELYGWFQEEVERREKTPQSKLDDAAALKAATRKTRKRKTDDAELILPPPKAAKRGNGRAAAA
jgi:hypothetical protein